MESSSDRPSCPISDYVHHPSPFLGRPLTPHMYRTVLTVKCPTNLDDEGIYACQTDELGNHSTFHSSGHTTPSFWHHSQRLLDCISCTTFPPLGISECEATATLSNVNKARPPSFVSPWRVFPRGSSDIIGGWAMAPPMLMQTPCA